MPDRVVIDHFGFELLDLTPEQARARRACHEEASRREAKSEWAAIDRDRTSLPPHDSLKRLARKVNEGVRLALCCYSDDCSLKLARVTKKKEKQREREQSGKRR